MKSITETVRVDAPADQVWDFVSDIARGAEAIPAILRVEMLSEQTTGLGTKWRETRTMFGREATEVLEITEWRAPQEYVVTAANHGCEYRSVIRVKPEGRGCQLEFEFGATPKTLTARFMSFVMASMMAKSIRKMLSDDLAALKAHCENAARGGAR